jgi:hypothetical protein
MRDKIRQLILNSKLKVEQKRWVLDFLNYQDDKVLSDFYEVIKEENNLKYFSRSLGSKIQAAQINNMDSWNKLLEEDEKYLSGI